MPVTLTLGDAIETAIADALRSGSGPDPALLARGVAAAVEPVIQHAANAEPWWRSRVTWGALLSLATPLFALAGWELGEADRETIVSAIVALGPAIGAGLTLYGRWAASRPIGL